MSGLPFFNCYPSDFLAGMAGLDAEEIGVYWVMTLLIYDRGGACPDDIDHIAWRCRLSKRRTQSIIDSLIGAGKLERVDGGFSNNRAKKEIKKREKFAEISRENGKEHKPKRDSGSNENNDLGNPAGTQQEPSGNPLPEARTRTKESPASPLEEIGFWLRTLVADEPVLLATDAHQIQALLDEGLTRGDVQAGIKAALESGFRPRYWSKLVGWIRRAAQDRLASTIAPPVARKPVSDEVWHQAVAHFKAGSRWPFGKDSPAPGEPGCSIPPHILEAHGFAKAAA